MSSIGRLFLVLIALALAGGRAGAEVLGVKGVRIFNGYQYGPSGVEDDVNAWLAAQRGLKIERITVTKGYGSSTKLLVWYRKTAIPAALVRERVKVIQELCNDPENGSLQGCDEYHSALASAFLENAEVLDVASGESNIQPGAVLLAVLYNP